MQRQQPRLDGTRSLTQNKGNRHHIVTDIIRNNYRGKAEDKRKHDREERMEGKEEKRTESEGQSIAIEERREKRIEEKRNNFGRKKKQHKKPSWKMGYVARDA